MKTQSVLIFLVCFALNSLPARAAPRAPTPTPETEAQGLQLQQIQPGSVWEKLGLKNGDTILSINGKKPAATAEGIQKALSELSTQEHLKLKMICRIALTTS